LTVIREAGFAKIWAWNAKFFCLSVGNSGNRHDPSTRSSGKSESTRREQNINRKGHYLHINLLAFAEISLSLMYFWERKNGILDSGEKKCGMWDSREKGAAMRDQDPPSIL